MTNASNTRQCLKEALKYTKEDYWKGEIVSVYYDKNDVGEKLFFSNDPNNGYWVGIMMACVSILCFGFLGASFLYGGWKGKAYQLIN